MTDMFGEVGGIFLSAINGIVWLIPLLILIVIFGALFIFGAFTPKPYTVIEHIRRANGGFKTRVVKASKMPGGKVRLHYTLTESRVIPGWNDEYVHEGNIVYGIANSDKEMTWVSGIEETSVSSPDSTDKGTALNYKVAIPEAAALAFITGYDISYQITHQKNKWVEYLPIIAIVVAAVILILPFLLGMGGVADKFGKAADAINAQTAMIQSTFANTTTIKYVTPTEYTPGTSGAATTGVNRPPG